MRRRNATRVLDGAPVLLGTGGDFSDVGDETVSVGAIVAIEAFEEVEVTEFAAVEEDVGIARDFRDAVDRKRKRLIDGDEKIEQQKRDDAGVDERRGERDEKSGLADVAPQGSLQLAMLSLDFLPKTRPSLCAARKRAIRFQTP